jgi:hypothetical protein
MWLTSCNYFTTKKLAILRGFRSYFAGVSNPRRLFCGSYENYHLIDSHKFFAAVLGYRWYPVKNPCKIAAGVQLINNSMDTSNSIL